MNCAVKQHYDTVSTMYVSFALLTCLFRNFQEQIDTLGALYHSTQPLLTQVSRIAFHARRELIRLLMIIQRAQIYIML